MTRGLLICGALLLGCLASCSQGNSNGGLGNASSAGGSSSFGTVSTGGATATTSSLTTGDFGTTGSTSTSNTSSGGASSTGSFVTDSTVATSGNAATNGNVTTSGDVGTTGQQSTSVGGATSTGAGGGVGTAMGGGAGTSAAGGAGGTAGTTTDSGFQPCPETGPCKVLPLGDSITFGIGFDGGYRVELFRLALADGHDITFTGTQAPNGPSMVDGVTFPRNHEGVSGETIQQIANRVPSPALDEIPNIVLLHAGTNDMVQDANGADMRLGALMDELTNEAPDALIVVSNIIPLSFGGSSVDTFNATIPGMVEERANAGAHIVFADQFTGFPTSELGDGVHPNEEGYSRMAGVWYDVIEPYLR